MCRKFRADLLCCRYARLLTRNWRNLANHRTTSQSRQRGQHFDPFGICVSDPVPTDVPRGPSAKAPFILYRFIFRDFMSVLRNELRAINSRPNSNKSNARPGPIISDHHGTWHAKRNAGWAHSEPATNSRGSEG